MEFVITLHPERKAGIRMNNEVYGAIKDAMLNTLIKQDGVPSESFFGILHAQFVDIFGDNTGWYLYQVKLDMEARGLIKSEYVKGGRNTRAIIKILKSRRIPKIFK